jgi:hypothetical protein
MTQDSDPSQIPTREAPRRGSHEPGVQVGNTAPPRVRDGEPEYHVYHVQRTLVYTR